MYGPSVRLHVKPLRVEKMAGAQRLEFWHVDHTTAIHIRFLHDCQHIVLSESGTAQSLEGGVHLGQCHNVVLVCVDESEEVGSDLTRSLL